jgi:hypothetical protein
LQRCVVDYSDALADYGGAFADYGDAFVDYGGACADYSGAPADYSDANRFRIGPNLPERRVADGKIYNYGGS